MITARMEQCFNRNLLEPMGPTRRRPNRLRCTDIYIHIYLYMYVYDPFPNGFSPARFAFLEIRLADSRMLLGSTSSQSETALATCENARRHANPLAGPVCPGGEGRYCLCPSMHCPMGIFINLLCLCLSLSLWCRVSCCRRCRLRTRVPCVC